MGESREDRVIGGIDLATWQFKHVWKIRLVWCALEKKDLRTTACAGSRRKVVGGEESESGDADDEFIVWFAGARRGELLKETGSG